MQYFYLMLHSRYVNWSLISILMGARGITLFVKKTSDAVRKTALHDNYSKNINAARNHERNLYTLDKIACMYKL